MAATAVLPQKRVLGETKTRQNMAPSPSNPNATNLTVMANKKRRTGEGGLSSSPASSQTATHGRPGQQPVKSVFESEVLEKLSQDISAAKQNSQVDKDQSWDRPPLVDFVPSRDSLALQAIEAEEGTLHGGSATVKLFGVTAEGHSVMLHVTGFKHYLYVAAPIAFQPQDCPAFKAYLESQLAQHQPAIHSVSLVMRESIYGFQGNTQNPYLKVTVTDPKFIGRVRSTIKEGNANWKGMWKTVDGGIMTFDNIQYVLRFMVDCKVNTFLIISRLG